MRWRYGLHAAKMTKFFGRSSPFSERSPERNHRTYCGHVNLTCSARYDIWYGRWAFRFKSMRKSVQNSNSIRKWDFCKSQLFKSIRKLDFKKSQLRITFKSIRKSKISKNSLLSVIYQIYELAPDLIRGRVYALHMRLFANTLLGPTTYAYWRTRLSMSIY